MSEASILQESLGSLVRLFSDKVSQIKDSLLWKNLEPTPENRDALIRLQGEIVLVERHFQELRGRLASEKKHLEKTETLIEALCAQKAHILFLQENAPSHLPGFQRAQKSKGKKKTVSEGGASKASEEDEERSTKRRKHTADGGRLSTPPPSTSKPANSLPQVPTIVYVSKDELESVPQYMRGRLTLDRLNESIDELQGLLGRKYVLMQTPFRRVPDEQRGDYKFFKEFELRSLRGKHFLCDREVWEFTKVKNDMTGKSVMTVLRHLGRIKEAREKGLTRYIVE